MARRSRLIEELADKWEPRLRREFLRAIADVANRTNVSAIERLLANGDVEGAVRAVGLDPGDFTPFAIDHARAYTQGGIAAAGTVPTPRTEEGFRLNFRFDVRNPRAERWISERSSTLIQEIVEDQRNMVRRHLTDGLTAGRNPRQTALDLVGRTSPGSNVRQGGVIGLHSTQERWLSSYAADLGSSDPATLAKLLDRGLRDRRFDRSVLKAIREGTGLPAEIRAKMRTAYANRALKWRGDAIARTETMRALGAAQTEAWNQAIDKGVVQRGEIRRFWETSRDERVRHTHRQIPIMNPDGVGFDVPFETPTGPSMHAPHDTDVMCRCRERIEVDHLANVAPASAQTVPTITNEEAKDYVLSRGRADGKEHLVIFERDTNRLISQATSGKTGAVRMDAAMIEAVRARDGRGLVVHHNHPSSTSFSLADLQQLTGKNNIREIWAHGHDGSSYFGRARGKRLTVATHGRHRRALESDIRQVLGVGAVSGRDANAAFGHLLNTRLADLGYLEYNWTLSNEMQASVDTVTRWLRTLRASSS